MKIKMLLIKKGKFNNRMTTEIFKCYKNCTFFDAQNDGNHISELLGFKFFWGGMPPDPLEERGLAAYYTFSGGF